MRKLILSFLVIGFISVLLGCVSNPPVPLAAKATTPQVLLDVGNRLGVDFSNKIFSEQTSCRDDFVEYYGNKEAWFRLVCVNNRAMHTDILWVRSYFFEERFVKQASIITGRANSVPAADVVITFKKRDNNKHYFLVQIGSIATSYQGVFFKRTPKSESLGIEVAFLVKGTRLEDVERRLNEIEQALKEIQQTAAL
jgi:hypothetical protein